MFAATPGGYWCAVRVPGSSTSRAGSESGRRIRNAGVGVAGAGLMVGGSVSTRRCLRHSNGAMAASFVLVKKKEGEKRSTVRTEQVLDSIDVRIERFHKSYSASLICLALLMLGILYGPPPWNF